MSSRTCAGRPVSTFPPTPLSAPAGSAAPCRLPKSRRDPQSLGALARRCHRALGSRLEAGRKGLAIRRLYCWRVSCRAPVPCRPRPCRFQADRCPGRDCRSGGVRHRPAGPGSASPSPTEACSPGRAPAIRGRMDAADALARAGEGERPQAEEGGRQLAMCCSPRARLAETAQARSKPAVKCLDSRASSLRTRPKPRNHRHRQQARYSVAALRRAVVADRRRGICAARRSRHRSDRSRDRSAFRRPTSAPAATSCSSAASPIPASAGRPSRRSGNISATCAPATAVPIRT